MPYFPHESPRLHLHVCGVVEDLSGNDLCSVKPFHFITQQDQVQSKGALVAI
jgi:hypothetical protein